MAASDRSFGDTRPCESCAQLSRVRYRVQVGSGQPWQLVCPTCQQQFSQQPGYRYGGAWKSKAIKARRSQNRK